MLAIMLGLNISLSAQFIGNYSHMIPTSFSYQEIERSGNAMTINYDQSDELIFGLNYKRALFPIHKGYDVIAGQNLVYAMYTLDSLIKSDNSYQVSFSNISGVVLDSMDLQLSHVNHSLANDTIILTLLSLDTVNFPNGSVLLTDTLVINVPLSPGNNLANTTSLRWKPNYIMDNQPIGLKFEFFGSLQDTLALMSGFGIYPAPNTCTDSSWDKARKSIYYPNSYGYWSNFNLILPTNTQGDLFYDCNGNILKDTSDSESYIQNWSITSYISAPEIGWKDEELNHLTIYPNPVSNIMYVKGVDMADKVHVYDCSGACIKTFNYTSYLDVTDLNNGIYIFAIEYEKRTVHKKVVIQH